MKLTRNIEQFPFVKIDQAVSSKSTSLFTLKVFFHLANLDRSISLDRDFPNQLLVDISNTLQPFPLQLSLDDDVVVEEGSDDFGELF